MRTTRPSWRPRVPVPGDVPFPVPDPDEFAHRRSAEYLHDDLLGGVEVGDDDASSKAIALS